MRAAGRLKSSSSEASMASSNSKFGRGTLAAAAAAGDNPALQHMFGAAVVHKVVNWR